MYCRKCGRALLDDDNFCPKCGEEVIREREEKPEEIFFDPQVVPEKREEVKFDWDLDDFKRQKKTSDDTVQFDWGDLLGVKKEKSLDEKIKEASQMPSPQRREPVSDFVFTPQTSPKESGLPPKESVDIDKFYTFNRKNAEFQELLNREHERIKKASEERNARMENFDTGMVNEEIILDEPEADVSEEEREMSFLEKRRLRREKEKTTYIPVRREKEEIPLKIDENELEGSWPAEPCAAPEEEKPDQLEEMAKARAALFKEPVPALEETIQEQLEADAREADTPKKARVATQQISRDQFAEFLKKAEEQFGIESVEDEETEEYTDVEEIIEEIPEVDDEKEIVETEVSEPVCEVEPVIQEVVPCEEPEADEMPAVVPVKKKQGRKTREETGEFHLGDFKDDNFWGSEVTEDEYDEDDRGGKNTFVTVLIVILSIALALQVAVMVIRFMFPASAAAEFIEPYVSVIENWIRGLFSKQ